MAGYGKLCRPPVQNVGEIILLGRRCHCYQLTFSWPSNPEVSYPNPLSINIFGSGFHPDGVYLFTLVRGLAFFCPRAELKTFSNLWDPLFQQTRPTKYFFSSTKYCEMKNYFKCRAKDFGGLDLARGPFIAHPCPISIFPKALPPVNI